MPKLDSAAFRPPSAKPAPQSPFCSPPPGAQRPPGPKQHLVQPPSAKAALSSRRQKCLATWMCLLQALGSARPRFSILPMQPSTRPQPYASLQSEPSKPTFLFASGSWTSASAQALIYCGLPSSMLRSPTCRTALRVSLRRSKPSKPCPGYLVLQRSLALRTSSPDRSLQLAALCARERVFCDPSCPTQLALLLGGVLLAAHASLRPQPSCSHSYRHYGPRHCLCLGPALAQACSSLRPPRQTGRIYGQPCAQTLFCTRSLLPSA